MANVWELLRKFEGGVVIETWQEGNDWYRKWSDGWVEQGGSVQNSNKQARIVVTLPIKFVDADKYMVSVTLTAKTATHDNGQNQASQRYAHACGGVLDGNYTKSTTSFRMLTFSGRASDVYSWTACGYAAD